MKIHTLVCPSCQSSNTVPAEHFSNKPFCIHCDALLLPAHPIEANENLFTQFITHSTVPIVVDFWGTWSGVSQGMADTVISLADTFSADALFLRINSEQEQVLANQYKLVDIPTFILFTSGLEYKRVHGMLSERELHTWLERYLRVKRSKTVHHIPSV